MIISTAYLFTAFCVLSEAFYAVSASPNQHLDLLNTITAPVIIIASGINIMAIVL